MGGKRRRGVLLMFGRGQRKRLASEVFELAGGWRRVPPESVGRRKRGGVVDHRRHHNGGDGWPRLRRWRGRWLGQHDVAIADAAVPKGYLGHMVALRRQQAVVRPAHDQGQGRIFLPVSRFDEHCYLGM